jgi:hypothetical protein
MGVLRNVLVQGVHVLPATALAVVVAPEREPGRHVKEAGAAGGRVGHHDLALVGGLGQVLPGLGLGDVALLRFHGVEAHRGAPHVHAEPGGRVLLVAVLAHDGVQVQRRVGLQHAVLVEQGQAGSGHAHDGVSLGVAFSASSLAVMTPVESRTHLISMSGLTLVEAFLVGLELVGLQRGVHQQLGFLGGRRRGKSAQGRQGLRTQYVVNCYL